MNNKSIVRQLRKGLQKTIDQNKETFIVYRKPMVSDGFGGLIENPYGTPEAVTIQGRLSHEKKMTNYNSASVGFSTNLARYITVNHKTTIYENDSFEATSTGQRYRIGLVDPLIKYGEVIGYQANLIEAIDMQEAS